MYGHDISGLLMIKKNENTGYKAAFFNELGLNFFDLELIAVDNNHYLLKTRHINEYLDHKRVKQFLAKVFSTLLIKKIEPETLKKYFDIEKGLMFMKIKSYMGTDDYGWSPGQERFPEISHRSGIFKKEKINFQLEYTKASMIPQQIIIEQQNAPMKMSLKLVN